MKLIIMMAAFALSTHLAFAQTTVTVDANGNLNATKLIATTAVGQSFFTGHQSGSTYGYPGGVFRAITDNTNGASNYFFDGVTGTTTTFSVRADGVGYFAKSVGVNTINPSVYGGYSGITFDNPINGGILDFKQNGVLKGFIWGDGNGVTLGAYTNSPIHFQSNGTENMTLLANGSLGVGVTVPLAKLHVNGALMLGNTTTANLDPGTGNTNGIKDISFLANTDETLMGVNRSGGEGEADFISNRGSGSTGGFAFYDYANSGSTPQTELMRIRGNGQVLIGVSNFAANQSIGTNKLAVGGGILTEAVTVKLQSAPWPDNVFRPSYKLPSLETVKAYIDKNHHLSEIPSEAEVQKNGQNLGEMNRLLLKKVEELTLYIIEKDKDDKKRDALLNELQSQIDSLKKKQ